MTAIGSIITAIGGIIIVVLLALLGFVHKRQTRFRAYFEIVWSKSSSLKPKEIMKERPCEEYYPQQPIDDLISQALADQKNTLIVGRPLSGKTRAAYQALTSQKKPYDVLVPRPTNIDPEKYSLPSHYSIWRRPKLIFIDDLHRLVEHQHFEYLFELAIKEKIVILATCRSEEEYKKAESKMLAARNTSLTTIFGENIIEVGEITEDMAKEVTGKVGKKWSEIKFDGTIGSVFMALAEMSRRFNNCDSTTFTYENG